eukprot:TRINITY_DN22153_c0_g1_i1.p1 TRINITY_DN22153_c0_g1~~TRINITY_DN22153_c0_g1_i1.p1  ORF type:complete len:441 (+),score=69.90 TRINITY_DN22153_c0_g1_i1:39-1361(+)
MQAILLACAVTVSPPSVRPTVHDFATKTPYWSSPVIGTASGKDDEQCVPVRVHHLSRHGSRNGSFKPLVSLQELLKTKGGAIRNPDYHFLQNWTIPFAENTAKELNAVGKKEQYGLGARARLEFNSSVMQQNYNPNVYPFQATYKSRTSVSGVAYALSSFMEGRGILGDGDNAPISMVTVFSGNPEADGDLVLRPAANCPLYTQAVLQNATSPAVAEPQRYMAVNISSTMIPKMVAKLDIDPSMWVPTSEDLELFYNACAFETTALNVSEATSPCAVFDAPDYDMWAFHSDLSEYYASGHGIDLSWQLACPTVQAMMESMAAGLPGGSYMFSHAETLMPVLAFLGLYKDATPLTASMPWEQASSRRWRTGVISTMAVNVDMVLYNCSQTGPQVQLRHNERQVNWPRCGEGRTSQPWCSPTDLLTAYPLAASCNYKEFCAI